MKHVIISLLSLLCVAAQAQTDPSVPEKAHKLMASYFPMREEGLLYKVYLMAPDTFLLTMAAYKSDAYALVDRTADAAFRGVAKKDVDFYCLSKMKDYYLFYGTDSVKQAAFNKLLESKNYTRGAMDTAYRAMKVKSLTPDEHRLLDSLCYKHIDMNDSALFVYSAAYRDYLSHMLSNMVYTNFMADFMAGVDNTLIQMKAVNKFMIDRHIHDFFSYRLTEQIIKRSKDSVLKDSIYRAFMTQSADESYRKKIDSAYSNYLAFGNNRAAPGFSYATVDGKRVTLESLRGKYVYIDVWATWCVPCKREIPYLMEIEKSYEGKNIQFVSLSVDVPENKDKWKRYVSDNHLGGFQLIADNAFNSDFVKKFNIIAIPRFILIGPDGKIVAADARRPSDPELKSQLDKLITTM